MNRFHSPWRVTRLFCLLLFVLLIYYKVPQLPETVQHEEKAKAIATPPVERLAFTPLTTPWTTTHLNDILITVKTTKKFHANRLALIVKTWFLLAPKQTYFFTDSDDLHYQNLTHGHLLNTSCGSSHIRLDLSCKMAAEFRYFILSDKKWWCHFDDDNYVNVQQLVAVLKKHNWQDKVYIGQRSILKPITSDYKNEKVKFVFATGGAGLCVSRALADLIVPWCLHGAFVDTSNALRFPDDCTLGFIITNRFNVSLTQSPLFHSHLESLSQISKRTFFKQVSFSYSIGSNTNVINAHTGAFNQTVDPTRFLTLHCILHPKTAYCLKGDPTL